MKRCCFVVLLGCLLVTGCAKRKAVSGGAGQTAVSFAASLTAFQEAITKKNYPQGFQQLRNILENFWQESPLLLENVSFVRGESNSYGIFEPRGNDTFSPGETIYLYIEPVGYLVKKNAAGKYEFGFQTDFTIEDAKGTVLGGKNDFAALSFSSWRYNTEVCLTLNYTFTGLPSGKYKLKTKVKDSNSTKQAIAEKFFDVF